MLRNREKGVGLTCCYGSMLINNAHSDWLIACQRCININIVEYNLHNNTSDQYFLLFYSKKEQKCKSL